MDLGLNGKVAVITGGSEGIGKATAAKLAEEGASVVICARREDVLEAAAAEAREASGGDVTGVSTDVTDPAQLASLFDRVVETHGRLDILVNNAGSSAASYFGDVSDEEWQYDLDLKLFGAIRCSRLAIPHMRKQGGGRIVNVTAVAGKAPPGSSVPTSVSRAAGIALTKVMSKDYAADQILVNTVCIGLVKSGQIDRQWMGGPRERAGPIARRVVRAQGQGDPGGPRRRGRGGRERDRVPRVGCRQLRYRQLDPHRRRLRRHDLVSQLAASVPAWVSKVTYA